MWEAATTEFLEKYESGKELTQADFEVFIEEGLYPLLEEWEHLLTATTDLVDQNLQIFKEVIKHHKTKNTTFYKSLKSAMEITHASDNVQ